MFIVLKMFSSYLLKAPVLFYPVKKGPRSAISGWKCWQLAFLSSGDLVVAVEDPSSVCEEDQF